MKKTMELTKSLEHRIEKMIKEADRLESRAEQREAKGWDASDLWTRALDLRADVAKLDVQRLRGETL